MAVKDQHSWNSCAFNDFCVFNGSCWGSSGCRTGGTCVSPLTMRACWLMLQQISLSVDCGSDRGALRWLRPPSSSEPVLSQFPTSPSKKFAFLYSINMHLLSIKTYTKPQAFRSQNPDVWKMMHTANTLSG